MKTEWFKEYSECLLRDMDDGGTGGPRRGFAAVAGNVDRFGDFVTAGSFFDVHGDDRLRSDERRGVYEFYEESSRSF